MLSILSEPVNLKEYIEVFPDGIIVLNREQHIIASNEEAQKIFGVSEIDFKKQQLKNLFFNAEKIIEDEFSEKGPSNSSYEVYARNIGDISLLVNIKFKKIDTANLIFCAVRDVSESTEFDRNRLAVIVASSDDAIISKDLNGKILSWNKGAEQLFQYKSNEVIGKHISIIIPPDKLYEEEIILTNIKDEISQKLETIRMRKDGTLINVAITISPIKNGHGKIVGAAKIARDIPEKVSLLNYLKTKNKRLEEFAHIIAHNFRSPVNNILSLLQFHSEENELGSKELYISKLNSCVTALNETFDHLMDVLGVSNKDIEMKFELVQFKDILNKVFRNNETEIIQTNALISYDFSEVPFIYSYPYNLESILQNLITNAIKYRHSERPPVIFLKTLNSDGKIKLEVKDNGIGINIKRHGSSLFGFQKTFHSNPDARGVGLYIVKMQVESLGGTITVKSVVNEGSTFTISF